MKRFISIIIILAMLFTLASCGDGGSKKKSKSSSYEAVIDEAMSAFEKGNTKKLANLFSDFYTDEEVERIAEYWIEALEDDYEVAKIKSWEISYEDEYPSDDVQELIDDMEYLLENYNRSELKDAGYNPDFNPSKIKTIVDVEIDAKVKDHDGDEWSMCFYIRVDREGSSWKIANIELEY